MVFFVVAVAAWSTGGKAASLDIYRILGKAAGGNH